MERIQKTFKKRTNKTSFEVWNQQKSMSILKLIQGKLIAWITYLSKEGSDRRTLSLFLPLKKERKIQWLEGEPGQIQTASGVLLCIKTKVRMGIAYARISWKFPNDRESKKSWTFKIWLNQKLWVGKAGGPLG